MSGNFGGGSVMMWGAFGYLGKMPIANQTECKYIWDIIEYQLDEYAEVVAVPNFIFQPDNTAVHSTKLVKEWFKNHGRLK